MDTSSIVFDKVSMDIVGPPPNRKWTRVYNRDTRFAYQIFSDDVAKQAMSSEIVEALVEKFINPYHIAPKAWIRNPKTRIL